MDIPKTVAKPKLAATCFVISLLSFALCGLTTDMQPVLVATITGLACVWIGMGFAFMGILCVLSIVESRGN